LGDISLLFGDLDIESSSRSNPYRSSLFLVSLKDIGSRSRPLKCSGCLLSSGSNLYGEELGLRTSLCLLYYYLSTQTGYLLFEL